DKDEEYEVERIPDARFNRKKLQYRVQWLGYEDDPVWYDASNFKNNPHQTCQQSIKWGLQDED
ncbi:hypothetical protein EJ02DRAFT_351240, partial [Clathrospora elynae]